MQPEPRRDRRFLALIPALILGVGYLGLQGAKRQVDMELVRPLNTTVPDTALGLTSIDREIAPDELKVSGVSNYLMRIFQGDSAAPQFSVYVGYYVSQSRGKSIHSPKNCLPGAGWEPVESSTVMIRAGDYEFPANRYLLENQGRRALAYYWYQGRGRVTADEYRVKWELIRDRALAGRSDEALVRIVVRVGGEVSLSKADSLAVAAAGRIISPIFASLPSFPGRSVAGLDLGT